MADHKVPTHDGFIWPTPRYRMTEQAAIVERMVEDIADHFRRTGASFCDLSAYPYFWTQAQCVRYGHQARSQYRDASHPIHKARRPLGQPDPKPVTSDMADVVAATRATDIEDFGGAA